MGGADISGCSGERVGAITSSKAEAARAPTAANTTREGNVFAQGGGGLVGHAYPAEKISEQTPYDP